MFGSSLVRLEDSGAWIGDGGKKLIHYAEPTESRQVLEALLDRSLFNPPIDFSVKDSAGSNAIHFISNCKESCEFILAHDHLLPLLNERNDAGLTPLAHVMQRTAYIRPRLSSPGDTLLLTKSPIPLTLDVNFFAAANTAHNDTWLKVAILDHLNRFPEFVGPNLIALFSSGARLFAGSLSLPNQPLWSITDSNGFNLLQLACLNGYAASIGYLAMRMETESADGPSVPLREMMSFDGFTLVMLACGAREPTCPTSMADRVECLRELVKALHLTTTDFAVADKEGRDALHHAKSLASKENSSLLPKWIEDFLGLSKPSVPLFVFGSGATSVAYPTAPAAANSFNPNPFDTPRSTPNPFA
eukprot:TRINITY_DN3457_c0_g1_i1.p1 TRINITY_DN3457_c0_g1~~TRINITY_DN3457_c0_g1_i1.p1  ORF type:complete len:359 (+),score=32.52 TRINITY_DN3457_c0_g1_i1:136-1212(+)